MENEANLPKQRSQDKNLEIKTQQTKSLQTKTQQTKNLETMINSMMKVLDLHNNTGGMTTLMLAAAAGNLATIIQILEDAKIEKQDENGFTPLHHAAHNGHFTTVKYLVEVKATIDVETNEGDTALNLAAAAGHFEIVKYLIQCGAKINHKTKFGQTPLIAASANGHINVVTCLTQNGAEKEEKDNFQATAVMYAVYNGHLKVTQYLIETAKVKTHIENAEALSITAIRRGHLAIVRYLRDKKIDSIDDGTALSTAVLNGHIDIVDYFIEKKLDINLSNEFLSERIKYQLPLLGWAIEAKQEKMFLHLMKKGADINAKFHLEEIATLKKFSGTIIVWAFDRSTKTEKFIDSLIQRNAIVNYEGDSALFSLPLHAAISDGNEWATHWLISRKISLTEKLPNGLTPLLLAASCGHTNLMMYLLARGAQENNNEGLTPLLVAAMNGHLETVKYLVEIVSVNPRAEDIYGRTAMDVAAEKEYFEIISYLTQHGGDIEHKNKIDGGTLLFRAAENDKIKMVECLLKNGANIEATNVNDLTPLLVAARNGHTETVKYLYSMKASLFAQTIDGFTASQRAAANGHHATVAYLLSIGANTEVEKDPKYTPLHRYVAYEPAKAIQLLKNPTKNQPQINLSGADQHGNTPLHYAAGFGTIGVLKLLFQHPIEKDLVVKNNRGYTPLHLAVCHGEKDLQEIIKLLIEKGAELNSKDNEGNTPLHKAARFNLPLTIIQFLISQGADIEQSNNAGKKPIHLAEENNDQAIVQFFREQEKQASSLVLSEVSSNAPQSGPDIKPTTPDNNSQTSAWEKAAPATPPISAFFSEENKSISVVTDENIPKLISDDEEVKEGKKEENQFR